MVEENLNSSYKLPVCIEVILLPVYIALNSKMLQETAVVSLAHLISSPHLPCSTSGVLFITGGIVEGVAMLGPGRKSGESIAASFHDATGILKQQVHFLGCELPTQLYQLLTPLQVLIALT